MIFDHDGDDFVSVPSRGTGKINLTPAQLNEVGKYLEFPSPLGEQGKSTFHFNAISR